jgi:hypothetical protein
MTTESAIKPNTVLLALAKGFTEKVTKALRDEATAGIHHIEAKVQLDGDLCINEDYEQTQVNKACPWTFLQVAWNKMPEHVRAACCREVVEVVEGTRPKPDLDMLKALTNAAVSRVRASVTQTSRGAAKFNGKIWVTG